LYLDTEERSFLGRNGYARYRSAFANNVVLTRYKEFYDFSK
jgi:hypothetical protein